MRRADRPGAGGAALALPVDGAGQAPAVAGEPDCGGAGRGLVIALAVTLAMTVTGQGALVAQAADLERLGEALSGAREGSASPQSDGTGGRRSCSTSTVSTK